MTAAHATSSGGLSEYRQPIRITPGTRPTLKLSAAANRPDHSFEKAKPMVCWQVPPPARRGANQLRRSAAAVRHAMHVYTG